MISWVIGQMAAGRSPAEIDCRLPILPGRPPAAAEAATRSDSAWCATRRKKYRPGLAFFRLGGEHRLLVT